MPWFGGVLMGCSAWDWTCFGLDLAETIVLDANDPYYSSCYYNGYYWHDHEDDDDNNDLQQSEAGADVETIQITGEGDAFTLRYNTDTLEARLNASTGEYDFSPDPEGTITGASIDCTATIDETQFTGECFRDGAVCSFSYQRQPEDPQEIYTRIASSCQEKEGLGAFHVPENAPSVVP